MHQNKMPKISKERYAFYWKYNVIKPETLQCFKICLSKAGKPDRYNVEGSVFTKYSF